LITKVPELEIKFDESIHAYAPSNELQSGSVSEGLGTGETETVTEGDMEIEAVMVFVGTGDIEIETVALFVGTGVCVEEGVSQVVSNSSPGGSVLVQLGEYCGVFVGVDT
jgi:hypothetical protein